jgi:hypothetical protein
MKQDYTSGKNIYIVCGKTDMRYRDYVEKLFACVKRNANRGRGEIR